MAVTMGEAIRVGEQAKDLRKVQKQVAEKALNAPNQGMFHVLEVEIDEDHEGLTIGVNGRWLTPAEALEYTEDKAVEHFHNNEEAYWDLAILEDRVRTGHKLVEAAQAAE